MHFSKKSQYGLRAAVALAQRDSTDYVSIDVLSEDLEIPVQYLQKILRTLTKHDITESCRGPTGGIRLCSNVDDITVKRLIELLEGEETIQECPVGFRGCDAGQNCELGEYCPGGPPSTIRNQIDVPLRVWANQIPSETL